MATLITAAAMIASLRAAIEFGQLAAQHAPGGHPLFASLDRARAILSWLEDQDVPIPPLPEGSNTRVMIEAAIESINATAASVRNDPDQPLPLTIWPEIKALPWPWIAAGVGLLVVTAILFQRRST